jgi:hypothetical protein
MKNFGTREKNKMVKISQDAGLDLGSGFDFKSAASKVKSIVTGIEAIMDPIMPQIEKISSSGLSDMVESMDLENIEFSKMVSENKDKIEEAIGNMKTISSDLAQEVGVYISEAEDTLRLIGSKKEEAEVIMKEVRKASTYYRATTMGAGSYVIDKAVDEVSNYFAPGDDRDLGLPDGISFRDLYENSGYEFYIKDYISAKEFSLSEKANPKTRNAVFSENKSKVYFYLSDNDVFDSRSGIYDYLERWAVSLSESDHGSKFVCQEEYESDPSAASKIIDVLEVGSFELPPSLKSFDVITDPSIDYDCSEFGFTSDFSGPISSSMVSYRVMTLRVFSASLNKYVYIKAKVPLFAELKTSSSTSLVARPSDSSGEDLIFRYDSSGKFLLKEDLNISAKELFDGSDCFYKDTGYIPNFVKDVLESDGISNKKQHLVDFYKKVADSNFQGFDSSDYGAAEIPHIAKKSKLTNYSLHKFSSSDAGFTKEDKKKLFFIEDAVKASITIAKKIKEVNADSSALAIYNEEVGVLDIFSGNSSYNSAFGENIGGMSNEVLRETVISLRKISNSYGNSEASRSDAITSIMNLLEDRPGDFDASSSEASIIKVKGVLTSMLDEIKEKLGLADKKNLEALDPKFLGPEKSKGINLGNLGPKMGIFLAKIAGLIPLYWILKDLLPFLEYMGEDREISGAGMQIVNAAIVPAITMIMNRVLSWWSEQQDADLSTAQVMKVMAVMASIPIAMAGMDFYGLYSTLGFSDAYESFSETEATFFGQITLPYKWGELGGILGQSFTFATIANYVSNKRVLGKIRDIIDNCLGWVYEKIAEYLVAETLSAALKALKYIKPIVRRLSGKSLDNTADTVDRLFKLSKLLIKGSKRAYKTAKDSGVNLPPIDVIMQNVTNDGDREEFLKKNSKSRYSPSINMSPESITFLKKYSKIDDLAKFLINFPEEKAMLLNIL